jgi:small-conductance mechanosensitive channel
VPTCARGEDGPVFDSDLWRPVGVIALAVLAALLLATATNQAARFVARYRYRGFLARLERSCHRPWTATLMSLGALLALPLADIEDPETHDAVRHVLAILAIVSVSWLVVRVLFVAEDVAFVRLRTDDPDDLRQRRARTQITVTRRVTAVAVAFVGIVAVLMTFQSLRSLGAGLLASAGLIGIVAGLAAQSTLANLIAGVQLAFTDALHIGDAVVVEGEWGHVEDLTLMYVVVRLWDDRRLVLPTTHLTTLPFENWTRGDSRVLGDAVFHVDPTTDVAPLRVRARQIVKDSPLWDGKDFALQVVSTTERSVVVRVLASASNAERAFDLKCEVREKLLEHIRRDQPEALVRGRHDVEVERPARRPGPNEL